MSIDSAAGIAPLATEESRLVSREALGYVVFPVADVLHGVYACGTINCGPVMVKDEYPGWKS